MNENQPETSTTEGLPPLPTGESPNESAEQPQPVEAEPVPEAEVTGEAEPLPPLEGLYSVGDVVDGRGTVSAVKRVRGDGEYVKFGSTAGEWIKL